MHLPVMQYSQWLFFYMMFFMFQGCIEMIKVPPTLVCNDAVAIFFSSYVATIAGIISTESFVHTHDNIFL